MTTKAAMEMNLLRDILGAVERGEISPSVANRFITRNEAETTADFIPFLGDAKSLFYDFPKSMQQGDYGWAAVDLAAGLPFVGLPADIVKKYKNVFTDNAFKQAAQAVGRKSRSVIIEMPIDDYLKMAYEGHDAAKASRLKDVTSFDEIPMLMTSKGKVVDHEGRHRAKRLKELGYETMPVEIRDQYIRWDQQHNPNSFDYEEVWPTKLISQDGEKNIPFPIQRNK